jgi:hypothetical protein
VGVPELIGVAEAEVAGAGGEGVREGGAEFGGRAEWRKGVGGKCDGGITEIFAPTLWSETFITFPDVLGRNAHGTARHEVEPYTLNGSTLNFPMVVSHLA